MSEKKPFIHPYMPNSVPEIQARMAKEIGIQDAEELFADLPVRSTIAQLPGPMSEYELRRHIQEILDKNRGDLLVFCGSGCWPHYVPAVVDEIINRTEFKTTYSAAPEAEQGKMQALFEFQSLVAELIEMDVVNNSVYSEPAAAGEAINMARRLTGRREILVPENINQEKLQVMKNYTEWTGGKIVQVAYLPDIGILDLSDLRKKISMNTAGVLIDNPTYFGVLEDQVDEISATVHGKGAIFIVSVDPTSLGLMRPPGDYHADIVVGSGQPLGLHMNYGGNSLGFFACRGEPKYIDQLPGQVAAVTTTIDGKEKAYANTLRTKRHFFYQREKATSMIGSSSNLCAIGAAVYLSLLGPQGMGELAEGIFQRTDYALKKISGIRNVKTPVFQSPHYKEFVVNFDATGKTVAEINKFLSHQHRMIGGKDLSKDFPELGQSALFCITEVHSLEDIDQLAFALSQV
jgi:glycine dehydrogenase subunit 1